MKKIIRIVISATILIGLVLFFYFISSNITRYTGFIISDKNSFDKKFDKCIEKIEIFVFINSENSAAEIKKLKLLPYLNKIKIFNCAVNKDFCSFRNIDSFPVYLINGKKINENIDITKLSKITGCKI